jgi:hypothetical protein
LHGAWSSSTLPHGCCRTFLARSRAHSCIQRLFKHVRSIESARLQFVRKRQSK